jgi:hypothetical protein
MMINLQDGGVYADARGVETTIEPSGYTDFPWSNGAHQLFANDGTVWKGHNPHRNLIRVISEPDAPTDAPSDPLAHLFEEVPAMRKFIGGKVYRSTRIYTDVGLVSISNENGLSIYSSPSEARILAAALIAAADAIDREAE